MKKTLRERLWITAIVAALMTIITIMAASQPARADGPIYVDTDATGAATGLLWTDAYTNVQDALDVAAPGDEIWVAQGVYTPTAGITRTATFALPDGVALYGGFAATETLRTQRDWETNVTVLSGDIDGNDTATPAGVVTDTAHIVGSNAYHVVMAIGVTETAVLDGFTITAGDAHGSGDDGDGGGMVNNAGSPTLNNLTFSGNYAHRSGGGMVNNAGSPTLNNVAFSGNRAHHRGGGGMYNSAGSPTLNNVAFSDNRVTGRNPGGGGGMFNLSSSPTLTDVAFSGNRADEDGGGMYNYSSSPTLNNVAFSDNRVTGSNPGGGGGMFNYYSSHPTLINVIFSGNQANYGGGMRNDSSSPTLSNAAFSANHANRDGGGMYNTSSSPTLSNAAFSANHANIYGGGMFNTYSSPTLNNTILWSNTAGSSGPQMYNHSGSPAVNYSLVGGGCPGGASCDAHLLAADPRFVDADGADDIAGTPDDDLRLRDDSPAIDAGNNVAVPADVHDLDGDGNTAEPLPYDLGHLPRFIDHPHADSGSGAPPLVDMGAHETPGLWLDKTAAPGVLDAGERLTYTIAFHTAGLTATHVVISDVFPISLSVTSVVSAGVMITDTGASPGYVWQVQDLAPGQGGVITVSGVVSSSMLPAQTLTNTASVAGILNGLTRVNTASAVVTIHGADLALGKSVNAPLACAGDTITYTLVVTNHGPDDTAWIEIGDTLPSGTSYVSFDTTKGFYSPYLSAWYVGHLPVGQTASLDLVARVDPGTSVGTRITNTAAIDANDAGDSLTGDNTASAVITVSHADLAVDKTVAPAVLPGAPVTYTLVVTNHGPAASRGAALTDTLPGSVSFFSASPGCTHGGGTTVTCTVPSLAHQATVSFTIVATAPITPGLVTNTVTVAGHALDPNPSNDTAIASTWVSAQADLAVTKGDSHDPVVAGTTLTYTLVVTNAGPDWAIGVTLTDTLPAGVTPAGPLLALHLDEAAGATLFADDSGLDHHGTCSGDACPTAGVDGRHDQAVEFDNLDDFIALPDMPGSGELTIGMWVNVASLPPSGYLDSLIHHDGWNQGYIHLALDLNGRLAFAVGGNNPVNQSSNFIFSGDTLGQWVHLAFVYNAGQQQVAFYVNGVLDVTRSYATVFPADLGPGQIGNWSGGGRAFDGLMDEIAVYDRALSEDEVAVLYQNNRWVYHLGDLAPGEVAAVTLPVHVVAGETLTNTATVSSAVPDPNLADNTAIETTAVFRPADLAVTKTGAPNPALAGAGLAYTLTVTNHGPFDAAGVALTDTLPGGVTFLSASPGCGHDSGTVTCTVGSLAVQATRAFTIAVTAPSAGGLVTNTVTVAGADPDHNPSNNTATATTWVSAQADLAVGKWDSADPVAAGAALTYTLVVTNHGPDWAIGTTLTDTLPPGVTPTGLVMYHLGTLAPGAVATVTLPVRVNSAQTDTLTNTASVGSDVPDPITGNDIVTETTAVQVWADLAVHKTADPDPVVVAGALLTYTLTVTNHGPSDATSVVLTDTLPGDVSFSSASPGCVHDGGTSVTCTVGGLLPQATRAFTIAVTAPITSGPITNTVTVAGTSPDPDPSNDTATHRTQVSAQADLAVSKWALADPVVAGTTLTYTLVVTNTGPDWAGGVVLTDTLPPGVTPAGPLLALHLDEAAGATHFEDGSGSGYHGTCSGSTCPTAGISGQYGQAVEFDGADDFIALPDLPGSDELTIGLWVKIDALPASYQSLIHQDGWIIGSVHLALGTDGRLVFSVGGNDPVSQFSSFTFDSGTFGQWVHLAFVYDAGQKEVSFYVNGVLDVVHPYTTAYAGDIGPGRIGNWNGGARPFDGLMDEVVFYDRALSDLEVATLYQNNAQSRFAASRGTCIWLDAGAELVCDLGALAADTVVTVTLPVRVSLAQTETLTNTATVSGYPDPEPLNNTATETTAVIRPADLDVTKNVDSPTPTPGDTITYTVTVANHGPGSGSGVVISDTLPPGITYALHSVTPGTTYTTASGAWNVGDLAIGQAVMLTLCATVDAATFGQTITNTAVVSGSDLGDLVSGNNADSAAITVNTLPIANDDSGPAYTTDEETPFTTGDVLTNDLDLEGPVTLLNFDDSATQGLVTDNGDATFNYDPDGQFEYLTTGEQDTDTFTYVVVDSGGLTATGTVSITVSGVNDPPTANDDTDSVSEDSLDNALDVLANDSTVPDMGETLSVFAVGAPDNGAATDNNVNVLYTPDPDFVGSDVFTYTVSDGNGGYDSATITVTVDNVNDPPTANDDTGSVGEDSLDNALDVLANDSSVPDTGETLSVFAVGDPDNGAATDNDINVLYTPDPDFFGTETFTYTVSDGNGGYDTAAVVITVTSVNDAPTISNILNQSTDAGVAVGPLPFTVGDVETDAASLVLSKALSNTALLPEGNVFFGGSGADRTLIVAPTPGLTGTATITVTVSDGELTAYDTFVLAVGVNAPPEFASTPISTATVGQLYIYAVTTADADPGDVLTITAPVSPTWLHLTQVTTRAAILSGTPVVAGNYPVVLQVTDGEDDDLQVFSIRVPVPNQAPVANAGDAQTVAANATVTLDGSGSNDPDGGALTYRWTQTGGPSVSFAPNISVTTFTAPSFDAVLTFTLTITDALGLASAPDEVVVIVTSSPFPVLRVRKSVDTGGQSQVPVDSIITYTIVISNSGTGVASGVVMTDPLPSGVSFGGWVGGHPGTVTLPDPDTLDWRGDVGAGVEYALVFTGTVGVEAGGTVVNTAYYRSDGVALQTTADAGFTVESGYEIYLPLVLKN